MKAGESFGIGSIGKELNLAKVDSTTTADSHIPDILTAAEGLAKKAQRHKHTLTGSGFYATKFSEADAEATLSFRRLSTKLKSFDEAPIKNAVDEIQRELVVFFDPHSNAPTRGQARKRISFLYKTVIDPAVTAAPTHTPTDEFFPLELIRETRGYIERVAEQACGSYDQGWYDAAAVMARRLLETLIIETFEAHTLASKIQDSKGDFFYLRDLITTLLQEKSWNLSRNVKKALPDLKDLGDQSAHSRRYLAKKADMDKLKRDLRITIEELVVLSKLRK